MITSRRIAEILALLSFFCFIINGAFIGSRIILGAAMLSGLFPLVYYTARCGTRLGKPLIVFMVGVLLSYPLVLINNDFMHGYMHGGMVLGATGVAFFFASTRRTRALAGTVVLALGIFFLSVLVIGESPNAVFRGSANRVSTLLLALGVLLAALRSSSWDLPLIGLIFVACILAGGVSGILSSALFFFLVAARDVVRSRRLTSVKLVVVIATGLTTGFLAVRSISAESTRQLALERMLGGDVRYQIVSTYAQNELHGLSLFTGVPFDYEYEIENSLGEVIIIQNLHSSYLSAHSKTGIFVILILGAIAARLVVLVRRDWYIAGLLTVLLLRAFSDTVFILDGAYNFAFLFFLLPIEMVVKKQMVVKKPLRSPNWDRVVRVVPS